MKHWLCVPTLILCTTLQTCESSTSSSHDQEIARLEKQLQTLHATITELTLEEAACLSKQIRLGEQQHEIRHLLQTLEDASEERENRLRQMEDLLATKEHALKVLRAAASPTQ